MDSEGWGSDGFYVCVDVCGGVCVGAHVIHIILGKDRVI